MGMFVEKSLGLQLCRSSDRNALVLVARPYSQRSRELQILHLYPCAASELEQALLQLLGHHVFGMSSLTVSTILDPPQAEGAAAVDEIIRSHESICGRLLAASKSAFGVDKKNSYLHPIGQRFRFKSILCLSPETSAHRWRM